MLDARKLKNYLIDPTSNNNNQGNGRSINNNITNNNNGNTTNNTNTTNNNNNTGIRVLRWVRPNGQPGANVQNPPFASRWDNQLRNF